MTRVAVALIAAWGIAIGVAAFAPDPEPVALAQDAETDAMIWHFNVYRVQHGAPPLYTHPELGSNAQATALLNAEYCTVGHLPQKPSYAHKWSSFNTSGSGEADIRWPGLQADEFLASRIRDPEFNSVGVGRAVSDCNNIGYVWSIALAEVDGVPSGVYPTPTGGTDPTPGPITPTASPPATTSASATATPAGTPKATPPPTSDPTPTPPATASPTPYVPINGDPNCDGLVNWEDGMLLLRLAADLPVEVPCQLSPQGIDCSRLIDQFDALALFRYLSGVESGIPEECPPIGEVPATPTPTAAPTTTVTPTLTTTPGTPESSGTLPAQ